MEGGEGDGRTDLALQQRCVVFLEAEALRHGSGNHGRGQRSSVSSVKYARLDELNKETIPPFAKEPVFQSHIVRVEVSGALMVTGRSPSLSNSRPSYKISQQP